MIGRYPHWITIEKTAMTVVNGIVSKGTTSSVTIKGRFENRSAFDPRFSAKVYLSNHEMVDSVADFKDTTAKVIHHGKTFNVVRVNPMQTHIELWLE